jgi:hypothetical protein
MYSNQGSNRINQLLGAPLLAVLLAIIDSKNKLKRCWAELCRLVGVAGLAD